MLKCASVFKFKIVGNKHIAAGANLRGCSMKIANCIFPALPMPRAAVRVKSQKAPHPSRLHSFLWSSPTAAVCAPAAAATAAALCLRVAPAVAAAAPAQKLILLVVRVGKKENASDSATISNIFQSLIINIHNVIGKIQLLPDHL